MTLETSESISSFTAVQPQQSTIQKIVDIKKPVKCTLCKINFSSREEQLLHYHSLDHIKNAKNSIQTKFSDENTFKSGSKTDVETVSVVINDESSNIKTGDYLVYFCDNCKMEFSKERVYLQHLTTKKHFKNCQSDLKESTVNTDKLIEE